MQFYDQYHNANFITPVLDSTIAFTFKITILLIIHK